MKLLKLPFRERLPRVPRLAFSKPLQYPMIGISRYIWLVVQVPDWLYESCTKFIVEKAL